VHPIWASPTMPCSRQGPSPLIAARPTSNPSHLNDLVGGVLAYPGPTTGHYHPSRLRSILSSLQFPT
jgi:hypothetical protein